MSMFANESAESPDLLFGCALASFLTTFCGPLPDAEALRGPPAGAAAFWAPLPDVASESASGTRIFVSQPGHFTDFPRTESGAFKTLSQLGQRTFTGMT